MYVYMIVLMDNASDSYNYGIYEEVDVPNKVYRSLDDAKDAVIAYSTTYDEFHSTAYGMAFPYDSVTFESQLANEEFAPWGWGVVNMDDDMHRICLGIIRLSIQ